MMSTVDKPKRLTPEEETRLLRTAESGNRDAFSRLFTIYNRPLKGYILAHIRGGEDDAADIAQAVWSEAWEKISIPPEEGGFDPSKGRFYTFLLNRYTKFHILRHNSAASPPEPEEELRHSKSDLTELIRLVFL